MSTLSSVILWDMIVFLSHTALFLSSGTLTAKAEGWQWSACKIPAPRTVTTLDLFCAYIAVNSLVVIGGGHISLTKDEAFHKWVSWQTEAFSVSLKFLYSHS